MTKGEWENEKGENGYGDERIYILLHYLLFCIGLQKILVESLYCDELL
jgi:hypothetical protein